MTATRSHRRRSWIVGGALGAVVAVVTAGAAIAAVHAGGGSDRYRTATVATGDVAQVVTLTGTIQRLGDTAVAFPSAGTVTAVDVQVGQTVAPGQTLATLDPAPLQSALLSAQAQLAADEATLENAQAGTSTDGGSSGGGSSAAAAAGGGAASSAASVNAAVSAMDAAVKAEQAACSSLLAPASSGGSTSSSSTRPASSASSPSASPSSAPSASPSPEPSASPSPEPSASASPASSPSASPSASPSPSPSSSASADGGVSGAATGSSRGLAACTTAITQASGAIAKAAAAIVAASQSGGSSASARGSAASGGTGTGSGGSANAGANRTASAAVAVLQDQSSVSTAQQNLAGATLVAPVAGVVAEMPFAVGATAATSSSVQIAGAGSADVTVDVPVVDVPLVKAGLTAQVTPDGAQTPVAGNIASVGLLPVSSTSSSPSYPATVTVPNPPVSLATGSQAVVAVTVASATNVLRIPASAVSGRTGSAATVTVLDASGTPSSVAVQLGAVGGGWAEIVSGLPAGQQVVLADTQAELPGNSSTTGRFGSTGGLGGGLSTSGRGGSSARAGG